MKQLINILFCGYRRKLEIADPLKMNAETYTRPGHRVPQRVNTLPPPSAAHVIDE
jgi:hypothetical protein